MVPRFATPLIGRGDELGRLRAALSAGTPLVTVVGPGGSGKTRVAAALAAERGGRWCDLSGATTAGTLVQNMAATLDVSLVLARGRGAAADSIGRAMSGRSEGLVVLDNVEQVAQDAAWLLAKLVQRAPHVQWLVTSRVPLRVAGEVRVPLGPLAPGDGFALFVARAGDVGGGDLDDETGAIRALVEGLDGLPLAIELAASRCSVLRPSELLAGLDDRFDLLRQTQVGGSARHRTLRDTLTWSWDLLAAAERRSLQLLSAFRGGFDVQAARAILEGEDALDVLQGLCDRSLVQRRREGGQTRYRLPHSVVAFVAEGLEGDEARALAIRERHARWVIGAAPGWSVQRCSVERDNVAAVLGGEGLGPSERLELILAVHLARLQRGPVQAHLEELGAAIDAMSDPPPGAWAAVAEGLVALGRYDQAVDVARRAGEEASARAARGLALVHLGDVEGGRAELLAVYEATRGRTAGRAAFGLGLVAARAGDWEEAGLRYAEASELLGEVDPHVAGLAAVGEAAVLRVAGDLEGALERLSGVDVGQAWAGPALLERARCLADQGQYAQAMVLCDEAAELSTGGQVSASAGVVWARLAVASGSVARGRLRLQRALRSGELDPHDRSLAEETLAHVHAVLGRFDDARVAFEAAGQAHEACGARARAALASRLAGLAAVGGPSGKLPPLEGALHGRWLERSSGPRIGVAAGARALRTLDGSVVDLSRRGPARKLLLKLVHERRRAPGVPVPLADMVEVGWPGDRSHPEAAANRVYTAIRLLRSLGLADVICTEDGGYLLDPQVGIEELS